MEPIVSFYGRHLPDAKRSPEGERVRFSTSRGYIKLAPSALGTRITLAVGPRWAVGGTESEDQILGGSRKPWLRS